MFRTSWMPCESVGEHDRDLAMRALPVGSEVVSTWNA